MEQINYIGESLWIGHLSKAYIFGAFVTALLSLVSYFVSFYAKTESEKVSWHRIGKLSYILHGTFILSLLILMLYAMVTQRYEYSYVFDHVSGDLPLKYILSAFWEGQEGSFILWMFWHVVIGFVLIYRNDAWNTIVMATLAFAELWLISMLLGIHIDFAGYHFKLGSNPMMLLRDINAAPIFSNADYLSLIKGRGLNPLLQNYWMTIHPPFIFAAFALSIVPFGYAIAALLQKNYTEWLRPVLPWALLTAAILGISLIMGSLWAYEALSFGGYWAWDPVENTSLVPWIILVAGIHTNLMSKATARGTRSTFIFYLSGFLMIVYSTLLTRSGILGDTSAHAFTEMGLEWQLTFFLLSFLLPGLALLIYRYRKIPVPVKEEAIYSREFWMYVGSLVLFFSAVLINSASSLPVFNAIMRYFDAGYIGKVIRDPIEHYNKYQLWIAVFTGLLSGLSVWLFYRISEIQWRPLITRLSFHMLVAVILTWLTSLWISLPQWHFYLLGFASWFTVSSNAEYLIRHARNHTKMTASAISHMGFGIMAVGILASGLNFSYLSNPFVFKGLFGGDGDEEKYVQLIKSKPLLIKDYIVTYERDTLIDKARFYDVSFKQIEMKGNQMKVIDSFITRPNAVYANDFSKIAAFNPDTRHYAGKDIFTCVVSLPAAVSDSEQAKAIEDSLQYIAYKLLPGDTVSLNEAVLTIDGINYRPRHSEYALHRHDIGFEIRYHITDKTGKREDGLCAIGLDGNILYKYPGKHENFGIKIRPAESLIDGLLTPEEQLNYKTFTVKKDESFAFNGYTLRITGFDKETDTLRYSAEPGDIGISGLVEVGSKDTAYLVKPIFVLRGNAPMSIKDYIPETGLHIRLSRIDPTTGEFEIKVAEDKRGNLLLPVEIAKDVPRTDYIILEAKIFPGINLYWLGSIMMMVGLLVSWYFQYRERKRWT
ncbi:MAG: cytochrome c biogenesis protein CcsA [Saprospiraceae bacterium]|nr:cytochrome c biogenesis protein CcsA [Saprospiraceae bacterium]